MNSFPPGPPRVPAPPPPGPMAIPGRGPFPPGPPNVLARPPGPPIAPPRALVPPGPPRPPGPPVLLRQPPGPPSAAPPQVAAVPQPPRPPPITVNAPPRPPLQHAQSASLLPPSGDAMLQRAAAMQRTKSENNLVVSKADSDDDWSVDSAGSSSIGKVPSILPSGARHPSGAVVKQNVVRPPEVSKMPPPKPSSVAVIPPPRPVMATTVAPPPVTEPNPPPIVPAPAVFKGPPPPPAAVDIVPPPVQQPAVAPSRTTSTSLAAAFASVESKPTTSSDAPPPQPLKAAVKAVKDGARVQELEEEIDELRRKLERAEARLAQKEGNAGSLSREVALEKELDEAHEKLLSLRQDKTTLEASVRELQSRLASMDHGMDAGHSSFKSRTPFADAASSEVDSALKRSEREKDLEMMLLKTKKDKDKAIRIIVQIIGKDRIAAFLNRNAGSADILDKLLEYFANNVQIGSDGVNLDGTMNRTGSNSPMKSTKSGGKSSGASSSGKSATGRSSAGASMRSTTSAADEYAAARGKSPTRPAQFRSRMNDYFKSTISGRDY
jgi:hypothetical protein